MADKSVSSDDSVAERKRRAGLVVRRLRREYPEAECALNHDSAFQLLVATILSAQCTDVRVNQESPKLFARYPDAERLARSTQSAVEKIVKPLGFFRNKARNIREMAKALVTEHGGEVPDTLEELVRLPGVGRKTASVVLGSWFGIPAGIVVDTHVKRIAYLLGLTSSRNPEIIERDLMELLPRKEWIDFSHRIILHGRSVCIARRPRCGECSLLSVCPRIGLPELSGEIR